MLLIKRGNELVYKTNNPLRPPPNSRNRLVV
jgi:hypothetical protein